MDATSDNSGYAVRYRSPKPLRASHTRETLYAICPILEAKMRAINKQKENLL